jgi:hypothetical protein
VAGEHHTHMHGQGHWFQGESDRGRDDLSKDVSMLCTPPKAAAKMRHTDVFAQLIYQTCSRERGYISVDILRKLSSELCGSINAFTEKSLSCEEGSSIVRSWKWSAGHTMQAQKNTVNKWELRYFSSSSV